MWSSEVGVALFDVKLDVKLMRFDVFVWCLYNIEVVSLIKFTKLKAFYVKFGGGGGLVWCQVEGVFDEIWCVYFMPS